ncbi:Mitochondrial transcription termination factor family protein [Zostera marina]|uniref:Transcription termination factor MTERF4, chloroplastic n=1 Tax=Zostera marina TaxID=29655 RepID=A0A0K9PVE3_ZOSMR|nr:Mitochondrial transcription termination factor family protein [Zostera marina]
MALGVAKPTYFLIQTDSSLAIRFRLIQSFSFQTSSFRNLSLNRNGGRVARMQASSTSMDFPPTTRSRPSRSIHPNTNPAPLSTAKSLYGRPSLKDMRNEKAANRARVYEFLRGIGIVPDELDGLELPVTVDVMSERVEFLRSLGLTIADINNYPLVLGCSVKKNMIPVLDYLGKLGARKSTFTEFLRRYPQVLHASVVVDLVPVVKYLQGMDVKPCDIPKVLERYPEVLGFKLEGTMSTSVAYLVGIGVTRRQIGPVLTRYPEILGMRVGRVIKPFVEYLESLSIPRLVIARLIEKKPYILGFDLTDQVKPSVEALLESGVDDKAIASVVTQYPEIVGMDDLKPKLLAQRHLLESIILVGFEPEDFGRIMEKMPQIVSLARAPMVKHVAFLQGCGFSMKQVKEMVVGCPHLLALNLEIMKRSFEYFHEEMERDLEDLIAFPAFFTYGLESTVKPRHELVSKKLLKCSLAWLLNCSDEKFHERMTYDSIGIEEMEEQEEEEAEISSVSSFLQLQKTPEEESTYSDEESEYDSSFEEESDDELNDHK